MLKGQKHTFLFTSFKSQNTKCYTLFLRLALFWTYMQCISMVIIIIIYFQAIALSYMDSLNLGFDSEIEEQKKAIHTYDSLSPTPSPQPSLSQLQFSQLNISSVDIEVGSPQNSFGKGSRRGRKGGEEDKSINRGHWTVLQNKRYHWFLQIHYTHFVNRFMRRMDKIFKTMEQFVGSRQAEQCRSHHQKMQKKYLNFTTIITNLRKQHYGTTQLSPLSEDILSNGIHLTSQLATIESLLQQQSIDPVLYQIKEKKKKGPVKFIVKQQEQSMREYEYVCDVKSQEEKSSEHLGQKVNMLEEANINIGQIMLFNDKEENSSIFNSIFL